MISQKFCTLSIVKKKVKKQTNKRPKWAIHPSPVGPADLLEEPEDEEAVAALEDLGAGETLQECLRQLLVQPVVDLRSKEPMGVPWVRCRNDPWFTPGRRNSNMMTKFMR